MNKDTKIEDLFSIILIYVRNKRRDNKNYDGLRFWKSIKVILSNSNYKAKKWKNIPQKYYKNIMTLPEYYIDGNGNTSLIEENHFLIQTVRIPNTEKPTLRKIMQIALNIGQYIGNNTHNLMKIKSIKDYISIKERNIKLNEVLSEKDIKKLYNKLV